MPHCCFGKLRRSAAIQLDTRTCAVQASDAMLSYPPPSYRGYGIMTGQGGPRSLQAGILSSRACAHHVCTRLPFYEAWVPQFKHGKELQVCLLVYTSTCLYAYTGLVNM